MTQLPAEGRKGRPPKWPLPDDLVMVTRLANLHAQIDALADEAAGKGRAAEGARRKIAAAQEKVDVLAAQIDATRGAELQLWRELWATPQAVAWQRLKWTRDVALYARLKVAAEYGDLDAAKESRQMGDRLGLNPQAMLRLRWEIVGDEVTEQRARRGGTAATKATGSAAAKQRLRPVAGGG